jgi:hypothetical protein
MPIKPQLEDILRSQRNYHRNTTRLLSWQRRVKPNGAVNPTGEKGEQLFTIEARVRCKRAKSQNGKMADEKSSLMGHNGYEGERKSLRV